MKYDTHLESEKDCLSKTDISPQTKQTFQKVALNALIIAALGIFVNLCLRIDFSQFHHGLGEASFTESAQLLMLALTSLSFFQLTKNKSSVNYAAVLVSGFFTVLFLREMDVWFDMIAHGSWVYPALAVTLFSCYIAYTGGNQTLNQMAALLNTRYMPVLITSVVVLLVFTRLYGMSSFWQSVMGDNYFREIKNISEEATELMAYSIIAFAAIKTNRLINRQDAQDQDGDLTK